MKNLNINDLLNKNILLNSIINFLILWQCSYSLFINQRSEIYESEKYIRLAQKLLTNTISPHTSYRIGLPFFAKSLNTLIGKLIDEGKFIISSIQEEILLSFSYYIINLFISAIIFIILFKLFEKIKINSIVSTIIIYLFQLNSTYINMIAMPNTDIAVVFFVSLQLFIAITWAPVTKNLIYFLVFALISIFFKEYIYIAILPSFIGFIKRMNKSTYVNILSISSYISFFTIAYSLYKKLFDHITFPYSAIRYENYIKGDIENLIFGIMNPSITFERLQDFIQYSPLIILLIIIFSLNSKRFKTLILNNTNYSFLPIIIFILLSGAASYPIRIFYPCYVYLILFIPFSKMFSNLTNLENKARIKIF